MCETRMINKIRWIVGKKKPVEWELTRLQAIYGNWFPGLAKFTFRPGTYQEYTFQFGGFWEDKDFFVLRSLADTPIMMPIFTGDTIEIDGSNYQIEFIEIFTLGPCQLYSIWTGYIGYSHYGYEGIKYKLNNGCN